MKIFTVIGARPQFVKAAVISRAVQSYDHIEEIIIHSGQHFDKNMSDIFFKEMDIPKPHHNLDINGLGHGAMTGRMLERIEELIQAENPDYVLVFGDTNTTLAAALAAKKLAVKTAHVEAGVRNFDDYMPEEVNRYLVDRMAELNFCCTWLGVKNLKKEGFLAENINSKVFNYGDVMYDATLFYKEKALGRSKAINSLGLDGQDFVLSTIHRASNTDDPETLKNIIHTFNEINLKERVILPLHPRTRNKMKSLGLKPEFTCIDPVGYFDMLNLLEHCRVVITDSGGVVREAYFFEKPALYLLEKTPWPELVLEGVCLSSDPQKDQIIEVYEQLRSISYNFSNQIFGDGHAGYKIIAEIERDYYGR